MLVAPDNLTGSGIFCCGAGRLRRNFPPTAQLANDRRWFGPVAFAVPTMILLLAPGAGLSPEWIAGLTIGSILLAAALVLLSYVSAGGRTSRRGRARK